MTVTEIAKDLAALCAAGDFRTPGQKYWSDDIVSVEAGGPPGVDPVTRGKAGATGKTDWWESTHEMHETRVTGPFVNGDQFVVGFYMDVTVKESGHRMQMDEVGLYTVKEGKIVEERFFHGG